MPRYAVFTKNRSTPIVVTADNSSQAKSKARNSGKSDSKNVTSARQLNASERKADRNGRWIRTREDGKGPNDKGAKRSRIRSHGKR